MASQKASGSDEKEERPVRTPQRRRGRERVAALVEAAVAVFAEQGYEAATMTEIAARAGASIGSLYQFFPTKEQLAAELHARQLAGLAEMLDALAAEARGRPLEAAVDRLFARLVTFLEAHPAFVVLSERRNIDPQAKKRARARLRGGIEALLAGTVPPVPAARRPALAALTLHMIRVAALLEADDDTSLRGPAVAELKAMLRAHLVAAGDG
ncbi:transcriptional regulator, TetR family [Tistlia consotensis]|uniref:Transcriptional regulator, TetR family n=1 Tax=Tistlia consotensis USBA 355 TaxID=560819 RepID=A0A1Y6CKA8_9PROT|nr:TetR/AcrR family transcriptional regulator [Tistlia consotensis]SMF56754.1 transcriptional regulator, TetR family [Tistlia consotensis USBA 355]SNR44994.1 transcriptional regulator, TetR family [Tistlia consotensis]